MHTPVIGSLSVVQFQTTHRPTEEMRRMFERMYRQRTVAMRCMILTLVLMSFTGCTRVVVHKNPTAKDVGLRFYRPKPYLFITAGEPSGPKTAVQNVAYPKPFEIKATTTSTTQRTFDQDVQLVSLSDEGTPPSPGANADADELEQRILKAVEVKIDNVSKQLVQTNEDVASPKQISIQLQYLPDFAEEYSIQMKPGLGIGELNVKLDDGWNLTSLGVKTDQQTDEIINSVANLVGNATSIGKETKDTPLPGAIYATNIPFGFYEAVIAEDPCGRKQLYGWRYVGFMPFQACPVQPCGIETYDCSCAGNTIYGLVWVNGILQFKELIKIPQEAAGNTVVVRAPKDAPIEKCDCPKKCKSAKDSECPTTSANPLKKLQGIRPQRLVSMISSKPNE